MHQYPLHSERPKYIRHLPTHRCQNVTNVLQNLAHLRPDVVLPDNLPVLIERHLALKVNNLAFALDDGHRECAERRPNIGWVHCIYHYRTPVTSCPCELCITSTCGHRLAAMEALERLIRVVSIISTSEQTPSEGSEFSRHTANAELNPVFCTTPPQTSSLISMTPAIENRQSSVAFDKGVYRPALHDATILQFNYCSQFRDEVGRNGGKNPTVLLTSQKRMGLKCEAQPRVNPNCGWTQVRLSFYIIRMI